MDLAYGKFSQKGNSVYFQTQMTKPKHIQIYKQCPRHTDR